ncbi:glycogen binding subunit 70E [Lycorma delicatula]|uniref:glycogen binding subunit 70E n=1 Tax=Lycorma delicatula TaxID=130591 RepID=UPI003F51627C
MCSLIMPADYDVIVAHSPPVFSHSPPSYYSYGSCRSASTPPSPLASRRLSPSPQRRQPSSPKPRRPCLVLKPDDSSSGSDNDNEPTSPTKLKKKVVFADDRGLSLTHVRMLTEGPGMPPSWNSQFFMLVTKGVSAEVAPEPWEPTFPQPASNYLEFRNRLDEKNVSLENVIVKESEESVIGTVKVRNLTFEKEVFVRSSTDCWSTHEDVFCTYVNNTPSVQGVKIIYDTFSFRITLPPKSRLIEFCVCYRSELGEYWDNNDGKNYHIVRKNSGNNSKTKSEPITIPNINLRYRDNGLDPWSDFSMFGHQNSVPYW